MSTITKFLLFFYQLPPPPPPPPPPENPPPPEPPISDDELGLELITLDAFESVFVSELLNATTSNTPVVGEYTSPLYHDGGASVIDSNFSVHLLDTPST